MSATTWISAIAIAFVFYFPECAYSAIRCPPARPYGSILCPLNCPERNIEELTVGDIYFGPDRSLSVCNYCFRCASKGQICCPDACGTYCRDPIVEGSEVADGAIKPLSASDEITPTQLVMGDFKVLDETSKNANVTIRQDAIDIATLAVIYYSTYDEIAKYIKTQFDQKYGRHWACFVAPVPNGAYYTFESPGSIRLRWRNALDIYIIKPYRTSATVAL